MVIERFEAYSRDLDFIWPWTKHHYIEDRLTGEIVFESNSFESTKAMLNALQEGG